MIGCRGLDIEGESLLLVVGYLVVDILLDMIGGDRQIEFKSEPDDSPNIWVYDTPTDLCREDDITRVDLIIEDCRLFSCITIDTEYPSIFWYELR